MTPVTEPQLTPVVRHRLREKFPELQDDDLPPVAVSEAELVRRIATVTGRDAVVIRNVLHEVGAFVRHRDATPAHPTVPPAETEASWGSGVPDETTQSGTTGLSPGW